MKTCTVEGCDRKYDCRGYCTTHWHKWKKWGTPTPTLELKRAIQAQRPKAKKVLPQCDYCDDEVTSKRSNLCAFHMDRKGKGVPLDLPRKLRRQGMPGYMASHDKMRKEVGKADAHPCVDCGQKARDWSLKVDADIIVEDLGAHTGRKFSRNPADYEPRCKPCHYSYDKLHGLTK